MSDQGWTEATLGDLIEIKHGFAFKGEYFSNAGPYVVLTPGNFFDEGGFKRKGDKEKYYTANVPPDYILRNGDLLVAMTEQAEGLLGSAAIVPKDNYYLHNQRLGLVRPIDSSNAAPNFLFYLFNTRSVRAQIRATASGVKVRHTSPTRIYEVKVNVPPLPTQRKIVAVLSAYDDLIENNTRRIATLEKMARALYREWFVHFRFPGHENVKMVESELGMIPDGWEVRSVGKALEILGGGTPSKKVSEYWDGGEINWYSPTDLTRSGSMFIERSGTQITAAGLARSSAKLFPAYSVMLTSRATIGAISINTTEACTNQGFITCIPNEQMPLLLLYQWLVANVETFIRLASGATFKEISKTVFKTIDLVLAPREVADQFTEVATQLAHQVLNLQRRNSILRITRDLLLPRLVSGEVDVSGLDIEVSDAAGIAVASEPAPPEPAKQPKEPAPTRPKRQEAKPAPREEPGSSAPLVSPNGRGEPSGNIDDVKTNEIMAAFRQAARGRGTMSRDELVKEVSIELGYKRLSGRIEERLRDHFRAAIQRKIIGANGVEVWPETPDMARYERDELVEFLTSVMPKGREMERADVIRALANHLGFTRVTDTVEEPIKSAINGAIRRGVLGYDGSIIWRGD